MNKRYVKGVQKWKKVNLINKRKIYGLIAPWQNKR